MDVAENSEDTGTLQALKALDSLESKINQVQVAYQQFYTTIGIESAWKVFLDGAKNAINTLNSLPKLFGKVPVVAVSTIYIILDAIRNALYSAFSGITETILETTNAVNKQIKDQSTENAQNTANTFIDVIKSIIQKRTPEVTDTMKNSVQEGADAAKNAISDSAKDKVNEGAQQADRSAKKLFTNIITQGTKANKTVSNLGTVFTILGTMINTSTNEGQRLSGTLTALGGAIKVLTAASASNPILAIATGAIAAIGGITTVIKSFETSVEELEAQAEKLNNEAKQAKANYNILKRASDQYEELKEKRYESAESAEAYQSAVEDLAEKFPQLIDGINEAGEVTINANNIEIELAKAREKTADATYSALTAEEKVQRKSLEELKTTLPEGFTETLFENFTRTGSTTARNILSFIDSEDYYSTEAQDAVKAFETWLSQQTRFPDEIKSLGEKAITNYRIRLNEIQEATNSLSTVNRAEVSAWVRKNNRDNAEIFEQFYQSAPFSSIVTEKIYQDYINSSEEISWEDWINKNNPFETINSLWEYYSSLAPDKQKLFENLFEQTGVYSGTDIIKILDLNESGIEFKDAILNYYKKSADYYSEKVGELLKESGFNVEFSNEEQLTKQDWDYFSTANEYLKLLSDINTTAADSYRTYVSNLYNNIKDTPDIQQIIIDNGLNTAEGIKQSIEKLKKDKGYTDEDEVIKELNNVLSQINSNIYLSITAATENLIADWKNSAKDISKLRTGVSFDEAQSFVEKAQNLGLNIDYENDFIRNGDKLILANDIYQSYVKAYFEQLNTQAQEWEESAKTVAKEAEGLTTSKGVFKGADNFISIFPELSKIIGDEGVLSFINNKDFIGKNGRLTEAGIKELKSIANKTAEAASAHVWWLKQIMDETLRASEYAVGNYGEKTLKELKKIATEQLDATDIPNQEIQKSLNNAYSALISDVLSRGIDNINIDSYTGLIADDRKALEDALASKDYVSFIKDYADLAGKSLEETNALIVQAIEKQTSGTSGAARDALKNVNFYSKDYATASLDTIQKLANALRISVDAIRGKYIEQLNEYSVNLSEIPLDQIANSTEILFESISARIDSITKDINNGIIGKTTRTDIDNLNARLEMYGIQGISEADFTETKEGLRYSEQAAFRLYNDLKNIQGLQNIITFEELAKTLKETNDNYKTMATLQARINELQEKTRYQRQAGNVDLFAHARNQISAQQMVLAGYSDFDRDSYATLYSSTYSGEEYGANIVLNITPITNDGREILSPQDLDSYVEWLLSSGGTANDILRLDAQNRNLLMGAWDVDVSDAEKLDAAIRKAVKDAERLHEESEGIVSDYDKMDIPSNARIKQYEEELALAKQIKAERVTSYDESFDFMNGKLAGGLQNPVAYMNSWGKAFKVWNEAISEDGGNLIDATAFYNIVGALNDIAAIGGEIEFLGYKLDGNLETSAKLISQGFSHLKDIDGEGSKVDLLASFGSNLDIAAGQMGTDIESFIHKMAESQIQMLDAMIQFLETVVAMEKLGDIDVDQNGIFNLQDIFKFDDADEIIGFTDEWTGAIHEFVNGLTESQKEWAKGIKVTDRDGTVRSLLEIMQANYADLQQLGITAEDYGELMRKIVELAKTNGLNEEDWVASIQELLLDSNFDGKIEIGEVEFTVGYDPKFNYEANGVKTDDIKPPLPGINGEEAAQTVAVTAELAEDTPDELKELIQNKDGISRKVILNPELGDKHPELNELIENEQIERTVLLNLGIGNDDSGLFGSGDDNSTPEKKVKITPIFDGLNWWANPNDGGNPPTAGATAMAQAAKDLYAAAIALQQAVSAIPSTITVQATLSPSEVQLANTTITVTVPETAQVPAYVPEGAQVPAYVPEGLNVPVNIGDATVPVVNVPEGIPVTNVPSSIPVTGVPSSIPVTGVPESIPVTGIPASIPVTGIPASIPVSNVPSSIPVTGIPNSIPVEAPTSIPVTNVPEGIPVINVPSGIPVTNVPSSIPVTGVPEGIPVTGVPASIPVENTNGVTVKLADGQTVELGDVSALEQAIAYLQAAINAIPQSFTVTATLSQNTVTLADGQTVKLAENQTVKLADGQTVTLGDTGSITDAVANLKAAVNTLQATVNTLKGIQLKFPEDAKVGLDVSGLSSAANALAEAAKNIPTEITLVPQIQPEDASQEQATTQQPVTINLTELQGTINSLSTAIGNLSKEISVKAILNPATVELDKNSKTVSVMPAQLGVNIGNTKVPVDVEAFEQALTNLMATLAGNIPSEIKISLDEETLNILKGLQNSSKEANTNLTTQLPNANAIPNNKTPSAGAAETNLTAASLIRMHGLEKAKRMAEKLGIPFPETPNETGEQSPSSTFFGNIAKILQGQLDEESLGSELAGKYLQQVHNGPLAGKWRFNTTNFEGGEVKPSFIDEWANDLGINNSILAPLSKLTYSQMQQVLARIGFEGSVERILQGHLDKESLGPTLFNKYFQTDKNGKIGFNTTNFAKGEVKRQFYDELANILHLDPKSFTQFQFLTYAQAQEAFAEMGEGKPGRFQQNAFALPRGITEQEFNELQSALKGAQVATEKEAQIASEIQKAEEVQAENSEKGLETQTQPENGGIRIGPETPSPEEQKKLWELTRIPPDDMPAIARSLDDILEKYPGLSSTDKELLRGLPTGDFPQMFRTWKDLVEVFPKLTTEEQKLLGGIMTAITAASAATKEIPDLPQTNPSWYKGKNDSVSYNYGPQPFTKEYQKWIAQQLSGSMLWFAASGGMSEFPFGSFIESLPSWFSDLVIPAAGAEGLDEGQKNSSKTLEEEPKVVFIGDRTSMEEASNKNLYKSIMFQSMGTDPVSVIGKVGSEALKTVLRSAIGVAEDYTPEDSDYNYLEEVNKENQARYIQAVQEGNAKIQIPLDRDKLKEQIDGIIEYADENADKITWSDLETIAAILDSYQDLPEDLEAVFSNFTSYVAEKSDELDPSQIIEELKDNTKEYFENNSEQCEIPVKYTYEPTPEDLAQIQALLDETSARYHLDISDFEQTLVIDTQQAQENANQVQQNIESTNVEMPISGDTTEAIKDADQATKDISKKKSNIKVGIISDVEQKINEIIRKVQEKVLKLKIEGTVNLQTETTVSSVKNSGANRAAGNVALAKGRRTLLGELGPELYVTGGHYYVAGQNGAEFVDLPDDAIVFNHLQTKRLMSTGTSSRGKAIGGEKRAVAHAKGNVEGPAMASASAALSALKNIRALWDSILNASLQDLGSKAGLGKSSGGGGGGKNGAVLDAGYIRDLERWYNLLRQIDRLEQDINYQEQLRSKLEADSVSNGREIYESYRRSYEMLQKEVDSRVELAELKKGYYEQRMQEIEEGPWGDIFYFNGEGVPQMKNLDLLANVFASTEEGGAVHSAREQYALLQQAGFGDLMQFKEDGSRVEWYDEEGKEREEAYKEAVEAFSAKLDAQTDEVNTLREDYIEEMGNILELQTKQNEILTQIRENTIAVEEEVLKALEESRKAEIDELQKQRDALSNSTDKFIEGLTDSLNKEREMYNTQQNNQELVSMRRQLAILQRSGGSADQIRSLQQQIAQREQDSYFDQQQKQIDAVKEANDLQLERLDTQISLMTETLEYQKSNGLLWEGVHEIMQLTEAEIQDFITTNNPEWWSKSMTQRQNDLVELGNKIEQWVAHRDDISVLGETIKTAINEGIRAITEVEAKTSESQPYTAYGDGGATTSTSSGSGGSSKGSGGSSGGSSTTATKAESGTWLCVYYTTSGLRMARKEYTNQTAGAQISFSAHIEKFPGYTFSYADPTMATIPAGGTITMNYYYTKDPEKETEHGYRFVFNGQQVEGSGYRTKEQAAQAAGIRITNMLAQLDSSITEQRKKTIEKTAKNGLKVYERGGLVDFTGPAWVDGTKKKPEGILNAEQLEMLRNSVLTRRNPIAALLADYGDTIGNTANATTYNTIDHGAVSIDHVDVNLNIAKVSNDYDSRRIGQNVMDEMVKIAKKTKVNSLSRG